MFKKVLIANRGEIACRVAATLREMGIAPVAVYSEADRGALHTRVMEEGHLLGPAEPRASYLNADALIAAAKQSGAEAIHPGYGFLAENAAFAAAVEEAGLTFIGPTPDQIRALGDKRAARALAVRAKVPVVPGVEGATATALARAAQELGYPVFVKAALGGGGKGMRIVEREAELREAIEAAQRLAVSAFGDAAVYLEKRIERPRHVEVQILGDGRGGVIHLFERECSLQRRHQKVIEESPSPGVSEALRERLEAAAVAVASAARYRGAGTVEFLVAGDAEFYFLEMNTRLQVEHPVTELVTGVDLVRAQLEVAAGDGLPLAQQDVRHRGHAIEARLYAEDAARNFLPQAGRALKVRWPRAPFVRVDRGIESGDEIPVHYDPILGKIIAFGPDRAVALARLAGALDETLVHGVATNLPFLRALARARAVEQATFDVEWIEREFLAGFAALAQAPAPEIALAAAALSEWRGAENGGANAGGHAGAGAGPRPGDAFREAGRWRLPGLE
jgi:acetyl/propionyl-CoA carboxylase alpha subunit